VSPQLAAGAVIAHEQEHVRHNQQKAEREGMKATSTVTIHTAICPDCGKMYVSGGTTTTTFTAKQKLVDVGNEAKGTLLDIVV
jgi:hypothetical protein